MANDWESESISVYNDFADDGFQVTVLFKGSPGVFNPTTHVYDGAVSDIEYTTMGIISEYKLSEINNTTIKMGDRVLYIPAYGIDSDGLFARMPKIEINNTISIGDAEQKIVSSNPVAPGNVILLYKVQVRT